MIPLSPCHENAPGMISRWNRLWLALLLILLPIPVSSQADSTTAQVVRVIDGDTIQVCCVFGDRVKVRYIGIDTPETHHPMRGVEPYGMEAAEANRKLVDGKTVRLEFDVQQFDKYGSTLAYVYLKDGTFVNAWLVEHGYAMVMTVPPNVKHQELFVKGKLLTLTKVQITAAGLIRRPQKGGQKAGCCDQHSWR